MKLQLDEKFADFGVTCVSPYFSDSVNVLRTFHLPRCNILTHMLPYTWQSSLQRLAFMFIFHDILTKPHFNTMPDDLENDSSVSDML